MLSPSTAYKDLNILNWGFLPSPCTVLAAFYKTAVRIHEDSHAFGVWATKLVLRPIPAKPELHRFCEMGMRYSQRRSYSYVDMGCSGSWKQSKYVPQSIIVSGVPSEIAACRQTTHHHHHPCSLIAHPLFVFITLMDNTCAS